MRIVLFYFNLFFYFFRPWTFRRACFNCERKLFIQRGAEALPTIQWTAQSMLNISNWLSGWTCIYDCHLLLSDWLSTDSSGVDCQWKLPRTDWPKPHTPTDKSPSGWNLTHPPIQRLTDCRLTVTVCLSVLRSCQLPMASTLFQTRDTRKLV